MVLFQKKSIDDLERRVTDGLAALLFLQQQPQSEERRKEVISKLRILREELELYPELEGSFPRIVFDERGGVIQ